MPCALCLGRCWQPVPTPTSCSGRGSLPSLSLCQQAASPCGSLELSGGSQPVRESPALLEAFGMVPWPETKGAHPAPVPWRGVLLRHTAHAPQRNFLSEEVFAAAGTWSAQRGSLLLLSGGREPQCTEKPLLNHGPASSLQREEDKGLTTVGAGCSLPFYAFL